jgi:protein-L-isoaspartate(D-aspartate) O-methyltransferase
MESRLRSGSHLPLLEIAMSQFAVQRRMMVDCQLRTYDITDARILDAMGSVAREAFVAPSEAVLAYTDQCASATDGPRGPQSRYLLTPMVLGRLIQAAEVGEGDSVLDVACGTGYTSAVLSLLGAHVTALESDPALAERARALLAAHTAGPVEVVTGPLAAGHPARAPYGIIVINGSFEQEPVGLLSQLKDGGRLVGVKGSGRSGRAMLYRKSGTAVSGRPVFDAAAPSLPEFLPVPAFAFAL